MDDARFQLAINMVNSQMSPFSNDQQLSPGLPQSKIGRSKSKTLQVKNQNNPTAAS